MNYPNVVKAIRMISSEEGLGMSPEADYRIDLRGPEDDSQAGR